MVPLYSFVLLLAAGKGIPQIISPTKSVSTWSVFIQKILLKTVEQGSWPSLKLQFLFFCLNNIILVAWKLTNLKKWPLSQSFQNISWSFSVDKDYWVNHPYLTKEQTFTRMIQWVAAPAKDNSDVLESSQKKTLQAFPVWSIAFLFLCNKIKLKYLSY